MHRECVRTPSAPPRAGGQKGESLDALGKPKGSSSLTKVRTTARCCLLSPTCAHARTYVHRTDFKDAGEWARRTYCQSLHTQARGYPYLHV